MKGLRRLRLANVLLGSCVLSAEREVCYGIGMQLAFDRACHRLAVACGGFTLWLGAGASIAGTDGATPSWESLVDRIAVCEGLPVPVGRSMPEHLEQLAEGVGHWKLRRHLRKLTLEPISADVVNVDVLTAQALIGVRAGALVSFNIEEVSALPFQAFVGRKNPVLRTFRERKDLAFKPAMRGGPVGRPIYFPHGTLTMGNLVVTQSEYDKFHASATMESAVHLCMGGDLVILGMSLSDSYLRQALLRHRRWIRDIYWFDASFQHREWAHTAEVTLVEVEHARMWQALGAAIVEHDESKALEMAVQDAKRDMRGEVAKAVKVFEDFETKLKEYARQVVAEPGYTTEQISEVAALCLESGLAVPEAILKDPRCRVGPA